MPLINILPDLVIDQIAAGEVIERPSSVVKELLENAIDAGATQILIETEKGGKQLIRIVDNGKGMDEHDLQLCVKRFATSKISSTQDLNTISSFGFRGEALPSIGSISHMTLKSRCEGETEEHGYQITIKGGKIQALAPSIMEKGTLIEVLNLFFNVPARLQFLKTENTENKRIQHIIEAFSLSHLHIHFIYKADGREVFNVPPIHELKNRVAMLWGESIFEESADVLFFGARVSISGMVSKPGFQRRDRTQIKFFVNGRFVQSSILQIALNKFFKDKIPHGTYPFAVLCVKMDPSLVDVNVHPAKLEVRFRNEGEVIATLINALSKAFENHIFNVNLFETTPFLGEKSLDMTQSSGNMQAGNIQADNMDEALPASWQAAKEQIHSLPGVQKTGFENPYQWAHTHTSTSHGTPAQKVSEHSPHFLNKLALPHILIIGQLKKRYILIQTEDGLMIMDQHAAHERVRYENRLKEFEERGKIMSQPLLVPFVRDCTTEEMEILSSHKHQLQQLGFEVEEFGEKSVRIDALPHDETDTNINDLIQNWIVYLKDCSKEQPGIEKVIMGSCRYAIMFGDTLSKEEQEALVFELSKCKSPYSCPHGRPVFFMLGWNEINRRLGR